RQGTLYAPQSLMDLIRARQAELDALPPVPALPRPEDLPTLLVRLDRGIDQEEALAAVRTLALGLLAQTSGDLADEAVERLLGGAFEHDHRKARELAREARGMRDELGAGGSAVVRALAAAVATSWVHLMVLELLAATSVHGHYDARSAAREQKAVS